MMKIKTVLAIMMSVALLATFTAQAAEHPKKSEHPKAPKKVEKKTVLFNGKNLDGWVPYLPEAKPGDKKAISIEKNWSVVDGVMRCEGQPVGYIRTVDTYENYRLHVEWRWPAKPTNSGVLLHIQGPDQSFPRCIEAQLKNQGAGDLVMMSGGALTSGGEEKVGDRFAVFNKKNPSNEKPQGEWNTYDIVCKDGRINLTVNGEKQNAGTKAKPSNGHIALQSEGGPIEFRNVYLRPLRKKSSE